MDMGSNKGLEGKFKPHIGRIFFLRKTRLINVYKQGKASCSNDREKPVEREQFFGDTVLVLDETNTRICVTSILGTVYWIQKYYLLKELVTDRTQATDTLTSAVADLMVLSKNLKENKLCSTEEQALLCKNIEKIAISLRALADTQKA